MSLVVAGHGYWVNERAERSVWESMLRTEMDFFARRRAEDPAYVWPETDILRLYQPGAVPEPFRRLGQGVHDEIRSGNRQYVAIVGDKGTKMDGVVLVLDITDQEKDEVFLATSLLLSVLLVAALLAVLVYWGVGRLLRPLTSLAAAIAVLPPDGRGPALPVDRRDPSEVAVVAEALNDYMLRIKDFIARERTFINLASHELRSPIAVVLGSMEVALAHPDTTPALRPHLLRTAQTSRAMEELADMLLSLARDPDRTLRELQPVDIADELPRIVEDYAVIAKGKELSLSLEIAPDLNIAAPLQVVRSLIGNLIRNAIENSDRGTIRIYAEPPCTLMVQDCGHGMTDSEMARLHARIVRSGYTSTAGIGLALISRICAHFGWQFEMGSAPIRGTVAKIRFAPTMPVKRDSAR
ncbi:sensor histidine kinase [Xanthomonas theicola]|uniref:sensor histidine kinase n=1 Tax=Xanthomonas theicola TaxID=56464 RepID=UPI000FF88404|nr:ATP-binding protein [Xanthomonas theicola]